MGVGGSYDGAVSGGIKVWSANVKNPALDWSELVRAVSGARCLISAGSHGGRTHTRLTHDRLVTLLCAGMSSF